MNLDCVALALTLPWRGERLFMVRATDAIRLCSTGRHQAIHGHRACTCIDDLGRRDRARIRRFVAEARLTSFPLSTLGDGDLLALLRSSLKRHELVVLREGQGEVNIRDKATLENRRLVREIEASSRHRLGHAGRQYKLVVDVDLAKIPDRDSYEVVRRADATRVLEALANQASSGSPFAVAFTKAREKLTADWRPPFSPEGLILLRRIVTRAAIKVNHEPPITPSQLRTLLEEQTVALEIVVVGWDDKPIKDLDFAIASPDDDEHEGSLGSAGKTKIQSHKKGTASVTLSWPTVEERRSVA